MICNEEKALRIVDVIGSFFGVSREDIMGRESNKCLWMSREMAWYILHDRFLMAPSRMARLFNRAPTNIHRGIRSVRNGFKYCNEVRLSTNAIMERLKEEGLCPPL